MDQVKIGKFIFECRKKEQLTQLQLAKKLNITDRAISKWENGKAMPDSSLMLELCNILKISVNDLLNGELVGMDNYDQKQEELLLEMVREKQNIDKLLLRVEVFIGILSCVVLFSCVFTAALIQMKDWLRAVLIVIGFTVSMIGFLIALKFEQIAGYYECSNCGHKYVPSYKAVNMAKHVGRKRKMKCPNCQEKAWHKKVLTK